MGSTASMQRAGLVKERAFLCWCLQQRAGQKRTQRDHGQGSVLDPEDIKQATWVVWHPYASLLLSPGSMFALAFLAAGIAYVVAIVLREDLAQVLASLRRKRDGSDTSRASEVVTVPLTPLPDPIGWLASLLCGHNSTQLPVFHPGACDCFAAAHTAASLDGENK